MSRLLNREENFIETQFKNSNPESQTKLQKMIYTGIASLAEGLEFEVKQEMKTGKKK